MTVSGGGNRLVWTDLPEHVRQRIETDLGAQVVETTSMPGGFSPGLASALHLTGGATVFVKAVDGQHNPETPEFYRREARVAALLPAEVPSPRLRSSFEVDGWVVLVFDHVEGRPPDAGDPDDLAAILDAVTRLADSLDPSPVRVPSAADTFGPLFGQWALMAQNGPPATLEDLWPGLRPSLGRLCELESGWARAVDGTALLHGDLRPDNMLITRDGSVVVVDWPSACIGAPWLDLALMLPALALRGVRPQQVASEHPVLREVDDGALDAVLVAAAGYFVERTTRPPPPGLPTVRAFQRAQGETTLTWLRERGVITI